MNKNLYLIVILAMLFGSAEAGTVILSGSCATATSNNSLTFILSNSGNDTAANLVLVPYLSGATAKSNLYSIPSIGENSTIKFNVSFSPRGLAGTYSDYFVLGYEQGSGQEFSALFPCLVSIEKDTVSEVYASANVTDMGKVQNVNVSIFNNGPFALQVNVSLLLPPTLIQNSTQNMSVELTPFMQKTLDFPVKTPPSGSSYSAAVAVQYALKGEHYAYQTIFVISGHNAQNSASIYSYLPFALMILAIAVVLILLGRTVVQRRKRSAQKTLER